MTAAEDFPAIIADSLAAYGSILNGGARSAHREPGPAHNTPGAALAGREEREAALHASLAPGATRCAGAGDRAAEEEPDDIRTAFERDLDRIKHAVAFRTLAGKTQVYISSSDMDERLRTRLTHSIEVAQVATAIAQALGLNTALTEAIALGHDCGHGPIGHASEEAFSRFLPEQYDHAVWGADVTLAGLNLCRETLDGIRNHSWRRPTPATPEGEVVSWADRIAYVCHDADDAIRAGIITHHALPEHVRDVLGQRQSAQIGALIRALVDSSRATGRITMDGQTADALDAFRKFNYDRIYLRPAARAQACKAIDLLAQLVEHYADHPFHIPGIDQMTESGSDQAVRAAVAHVSTMTDRQVLDLGLSVLGWDSAALPRGV